jgi:hypothetical protein
VEREDARPHASRQRRVALTLAAAAVALAAFGAIRFVRFATLLPRDPGVVYRDPATLDKLLARATEAERAGDRGAAVTLYRFVVAVGQGDQAELAPYVAAARTALRRLGASDTLPSRPR